MPVQSYRQNIDSALEGQVYGITTTITHIMTRIAASIIPFGRAVTGLQEKVTLGATAKVLGISVRQAHRPANVWPATRETPNVNQVGDAIAVMHEGYIWVKVANTVMDTAPFVNTKTGEFGLAAATDFVLATNCRWVTHGNKYNGLNALLITNATL